MKSVNLTLLEDLNNTNLVNEGVLSLRYHITADSSARMRQINLSTWNIDGYYLDAKIRGDGHFTDSTFEQNFGKTQSVSASGGAYYLSEGDYILEVGPIQNIRTCITPYDVGNEKVCEFIGLNIVGLRSASLALTCIDNTFVDFSVFDWSYIAALNLADSKLSWEVNEDINRPALGNLYVNNNPDVRFDVSRFKKCTSLQNFSVENTSCYGTLESLLDGLFEQGKTSGSLRVFARGSNVTYNSAAFTVSSLTFNFSENGWTQA